MTASIKLGLGHIPSESHGSLTDAAQRVERLAVILVQIKRKWDVQDLGLEFLQDRADRYGARTLDLP